MEIYRQTPTPRENEHPKVYADRIGQWYATLVPEKHKKSFGQYLTPIEVAEFMAKLYTPQNDVPLRILDPGAGAGILSCALCESLAEMSIKPKGIYLEAYEVDSNLADHLVMCLSYVQQWLQVRDITLNFVVSTDDFVMTYAEALDDSPSLFPRKHVKLEPFDIVISNPPYFKIPKSDKRAQSVASVVHGQPNIYALFMAVAASLLKQGGKLIFITPRSYTAGPYFRLFREKFFANMRPEAIHLFDSRRDAFSRDEILQENVILLAQRLGHWAKQPCRAFVKISSSIGTRDLSNPNKRNIALASILDLSSKDKVLRIPTTDRDDLVSHIVQSWEGDLHTYELEISTGPVVPFRAASLVSKSGKVPNTHAPLIWMQNVTAMKVKWPISARGKEQYIIVNPTSMSLLVADRNYVLLRRFSSKEQKRRLTAAPLRTGKLNSPIIGLENHLNYIHRPRGSLSEEEAYGLATLLNSNLLDTYFRTCNGNTQVSATELRAMPLPPLEDIIEIGRAAMSLHDPTLEALDILVEDVLNISRHTALTMERTHG